MTSSVSPSRPIKKLQNRHIPLPATSQATPFAKSAPPNSAPLPRCWRPSANHSAERMNLCDPYPCPCNSLSLCAFALRFISYLLLFVGLAETLLVQGSDLKKRV